MADFDLSARITADSSGLVAAGAAGEKALDGIGDAARRGAAGAKALELAADQIVEAQDSAAASSASLADAVVGSAAKQSAAADTTVSAKERVAASAAKVEIAETRQRAAVDALNLAHERARKAADDDAEAQLRISAALASAEARVLATDAALAKASSDLAKAQRDAARGAGEAAHGFGGSSIATAEAGHAFRAFIDSVNAGQSPVKAFAQELPRLAQAATFAGDGLGAVGKFLGGPWGLAITLGISFLGPLVAKLFDGADAAKEQAERLKQAGEAADSYGTAQSLLGKVVDLTTGKLKTQNTVLIEQIKLTAQANILAAQKDQKAKTSALAGVATPTFGERLIDASADAESAESGQGPQFSDARTKSLASLNSVIQDYITLTKSDASQSGLSRGLDATLRRLDAVGRVGKLAGRDLIDAKQAVLALGTTLNDQRANKQVLDVLNGGAIPADLKPYERPDKPKKPPKAKTDTTTPREAEEIKRINEEFDRQPTLVDKAAQATRKLDAIIADLTKRKPPGFEKLIADANTAKGTIQSGLQRPYLDFIKSQQDSLAIQRLTADGRVDEVAALKEIQTLEKNGPLLTNEQKAAVLATVEALRAEQREVDNLRAKNQKYLDALGGIKKVVDDATQAFVRGDLGQLIKSPGKLLDVFQTLQGKALFDKVFGGLFTELEDQVNGTSVVKDASAVMADAVDKASASIASLGQAASSSAASLAHGADSPEALLARGNGGPPVVDTGGNLVAPDVVVTGKRNSITRDPSTFIANALGKVGTSVLAAFTNPEAAQRIGKSIGTFAGKGLEGAAQGSLIAGIGKSVGINLNQTGAQLGGAVGGILGGIKSVSKALGPFGEAIGPVLSIAGGLLGGLFSSKKSGGTSITSAGVGSAVGSDKAGQQAGQTAGSAVLTNVRQIANQLGGTLGSFGTITIGSYGDKFRVNDHGTNLKSNNDVEQFNTIEEAQAFALKQAIAKGAVTGLSDAVSAALRSSADVSGALQEALGVKALETALGGLQATLKATFDTEATAAAERLRLARSYGLDIVATEKYNEQQRLALVDSTLKSRISSLTDFLNSLQYGDLAEGSAYDKRSALLDQIKSVQADAQAGKDGAADKLAQLYTQLVQNSRDAFGTAGDEYTTDRSTAQTAVQQVIAQETARVDVAAGLTSATNAIVAGNDLTNETNDLIAQLIAAVKGTTAAVATSADGGVSADFADTYRFDKLGELY